MRHQVHFGLLVLIAPLVRLISASTTTWPSSQFHFSATRSRWQKSSIPQHYEAYIINNLETGTCVYVSFGTTQAHKELTRALGRGDLSHTERSTFDSGGGRGAGKLERIRVFSNDTRVLREHSAALCDRGDHKRTFPVYDTLPREGVISCGTTINDAAKGDVPPLEIRPILHSGDPSNRVDLIFFSDGYTESEKSKFFDDATRLAGEISQNQTFYTVKPLLNFWAAFTPSAESGIGVSGVPRNTTFGLYRDGAELRGIYYAKPNVARLACSSLGTQCDYPILLGNDPYYGGLGGEFTVITPSVKNGALVLRHELGHSIIEIGEEYDGGADGGYFGVDAAASLETIGWGRWLTDPPAPGETPRVERTVMSFQAYPWAILNTSTPWSGKFLSPGELILHMDFINGDQADITWPTSGMFPSNFIRFSVAGIPRSDQLTVYLDGKNIGWVVEEGVGRDRYFYEYLTTEGGGFKNGEHELQFVLNYDDPDRIAQGSGPQLCSVEVLEYGGPHGFNGSPGYYGVFPTFSATNRTTYRPTNEDCLMRNVVTPTFCRVCIEELWLRLLGRISVIEGVKSNCRTFGINLLPLAQFRTNETLVGTNERYEIIWSRRREGQKDWIFEIFSGKTELVLRESDGMKPGDTVVVVVQFVTEDVRLDESGYLHDSAEWAIGSECWSDLTGI